MDTTDPLINSSTIYKWWSRKTHEPLVRQIVTEHLCLKQVRFYLRQLVNKARFKRRTLHVPNPMQMSEFNRFFSFALDSAM